MMKIGYDAKRYFHNTSGLGNYSRDLVRILSEFYPDNQYQLYTKRLSERTKNLSWKKNIQPRIISKGNFSRQLRMGIDAQKDQCQIFHGLSGELPLKWTKNPIKKIVTIHDLIFLRFPQFYSFFDRQIHRWKFFRACKSADLIIAISEQTKKDLIQYFQIPEEKIKVIYQTCHPAFKIQYKENELQTVRTKFQLPAEFLLNVGTIEERKNLFSVVKAIKSVDIPLVIVGRETDYAQQIHTFIKKEKMQHRVFFLKNVSMEELAKIYQLATIFIYPSLYEGFGIPIIEALFSKTPVITSNTSCLPEAGGPDSLYVQPLNINDLQAKIQFLWEHPEEGKRRAERSFVFVQKFSERKIATEMMAIYESVLKQS